MAALWLAALIAAAWAADSARGAGTWDGVEVAWRDDPRPAADLPGEFEPAPGRRGLRRPRRVPRRSRAAAAPTAAPVEARPAPVTVEAIAPRPASAPRGDTRAALAHRGQRYGTGEHARQRLDLHLPEGCVGGGVPLVVWIRGTDWRGCPQDDCPLLWLVRAGYAVASVDYRPSDSALFPAQLDDCRQAIGTLQRDAELWGIDPARIGVFGRAAGGHLATLLAFTPTPARFGEQEPSTADVAAVGAIDAPFHLASLGAAHQRDTSAASRLVGGPLPEFREAARRASPLEHVTADAPPTLILHGRLDPSVPADQSFRLDRALKAAGVDSTLVMIDAAATDLGAESEPGRAILRFLDRAIGPGHAGGPAR